MNKTQLQAVFEIFEDLIIYDKDIHHERPFKFEILTSVNSNKIIIECNSSNNLKMFYVIDYFAQKNMEECSGLNANDKGEKYLNCELKGPFPNIFYTLDTSLTKTFTEKYT